MSAQSALFSLSAEEEMAEADRMPSPIKVECRDVIALLRERHPAPQWATFAELRVATGFPGYATPLNGDQRLDLFTLNTWPSSGFDCIAYEIKVSRGDFLRELRQPLKRAFAERVATHCLFVAPDGHVRPDEVPDPWGLILVYRARAGHLYLRKVREPKRLRVGKECSWPMHFIASILRRAAAEEAQR